MKKKRSMLVILGALFLSLSVVGGASAYQDNSYSDTGGPYNPKPNEGSGGGGYKPDLKDRP